MVSPQQYPACLWSNYPKFNRGIKTRWMWRWMLWWESKKILNTVRLLRGSYLANCYMLNAANQTQNTPNLYLSTAAQKRQECQTATSPTLKFPSLFFERFAGTGATCVSSMETEKTMLSQRSLSLSIIQSRQNREACRAPQHRSQLGHFAFFLSHFYKRKANGKVKSRVSKLIKKGLFCLCTSQDKDKTILLV